MKTARKKKPVKAWGVFRRLLCFVGLHHYPWECGEGPYGSSWNFYRACICGKYKP